MLTKVKPARERILVMGSYGTGKSQTWCTVAAWLRRTKSPGRVFVVDTDHAADRLAEQYDDFSNVTSYDVWDYQDAKKALADVMKAKPGREDWLVVDLADKLWAWAQDYYIAERFGKDATTYYMDHKKADKDGHPLADGHGMNWSVINKTYADLMTVVQRFPGHVLFCTPAGTVESPNSQGKGGDDKDVRALFQRYGVKPQGQKSLGFQFFTVLWLIAKKDGWSFTTVKDVGRENVTDSPMTDFVGDYLVKIAGWEL